MNTGHIPDLDMEKMRNIAIVGCGFSGSLLAYMLPELGYNVDVYERHSHPKVVCAGGIPTSLLDETARECGLDSQKYVKWHGKQLFVKISSKAFALDIDDFCTFDKQNFISDIIKKSKAYFHFKNSPGFQQLSKYDLVIDASGNRSILGKLPTNKFYVCYQVRAFFEKPPYPDFLMDFTKPDGDPWYLWMFPLSNNEFYLGCGASRGKLAKSAVQNFIDEHHGEILEEQGKILLVNSPQKSMPFIKDKVVGVGNNVGAITSLGEGNALSITTVKLLLNSLTALNEYQKQLLEKLGWLKHDHAAHANWSKNELKFLYHTTKCFRHYKTQFKMSPKQVVTRGFKARLQALF